MESGYWERAYLEDDFSNKNEYYVDWSWDGEYNIDLKKKKGKTLIQNIPLQGNMAWMYVFEYGEDSDTQSGIGCRPIALSLIVTEKDNSGNWITRLPKPGEKLFHQVKLEIPNSIRNRITSEGRIDIVTTENKLDLELNSILNGEAFKTKELTLLGWYYDEDCTNQAQTGDELTGDVKLYPKIAGFIETEQCQYQSISSSKSPSEDEIIGFARFTSKDLKDFKIKSVLLSSSSEEYKIEENGTVAYCPGYGTYDSNGDYLGQFFKIENLPESYGGGIAVCCHFSTPENSRLTDATVCNAVVITGIGHDENGKEKEYEKTIPICGFIPWLATKYSE